MWPRGFPPSLQNPKKIIPIEVLQNEYKKSWKRPNFVLCLCHYYFTETKIFVNKMYRQVCIQLRRPILRYAHGIPEGTKSALFTLNLHHRHEDIPLYREEKWLWSSKTLSEQDFFWFHCIYLSCLFVGGFIKFFFQWNIKAAKRSFTPASWAGPAPWPPSGTVGCHRKHHSSWSWWTSRWWRRWGS